MFIAIFALFVSFYLYRYWQWIRYLMWKWKVLPMHEKYERHRKGLCINCGYDLRGTPNRCPECGRVPPAAK